MANISNKLMNRMFRKIGGLVWDITSGGLGIASNEGIFTLTTEGEGDTVSFGISVNPIDAFGVSVPAFAMNTPLEQVEVGDIIVGDTKILGWVIEVRGASLKLLDQNGMTKNYTPPKVAIVGTNGVLVVKNLFNLTGGNGGLAGVQNSLLPLLALGGDVNFDKIMPLILMQSMSGTTPAAGAAGAAAANPMASMLPFLLMSKGGKGGLGDIDPMMLMMMSGGLGGGAGAMNPMMLMALSGGDLFGSKEAVALPAPVARNYGAPAAPALQRM